MAITTVKISGKTFRLAFTLDAMSEMADIIEGFSLDHLTELARSPRHLVTMLYIMAKQGELLEGRRLKEDRDWFGCHIKPNAASALKIQTAVFEALTDGLRMESEDEDPDEEKDVVLEEIKKNGPTGE